MENMLATHIGQQLTVIGRTVYAFLTNARSKRPLFFAVDVSSDRFECGAVEPGDFECHLR